MIFFRGWDLSDSIINPDMPKWGKQKQIYDLIGVSNHFGGMGGGHYTAYAFNYETKQWYYFDDSSISKSSESEVKVRTEQRPSLVSVELYLIPDDFLATTRIVNTL